jgi:uncharacterized protein YcbK (DUF882 family)
MDNDIPFALSSTASAKQYSRRKLLQKTCQLGLLGSTSMTAAPAVVLAKAKRLEKRVNIYIPKTGEQVNEILWTPADGYNPNALHDISFALRDHNTNQYKLMHIKTLEFLAKLQSLLSNKQPTEVLNGFSSPQKSNQIFTDQQNNNDELHNKAMALDIKMIDIPLQTLAQTAIKLRLGGVGLYNEEQSIHIDSGPIRTWS